MRLLSVMALSILGYVADVHAATQHASSAPVAPPTVDRRGTADAPVVVQIIPSQPTATELDQQTKDRQARGASDAAAAETNHQLVLIGLAQLVVFAMQLVVFGYQAKKLRETVDAAGDQAAEMEQSVAEAARGDRDGTSSRWDDRSIRPKWGGLRNPKAHVP